MAIRASMSNVRFAPNDPTLPDPWCGLIDVNTGSLFFWNLETNVQTTVRPIADPHPPPSLTDLINRRISGKDINRSYSNHQLMPSGQQNATASEDSGEKCRHKNEKGLLVNNSETINNIVISPICIATEVKEPSIQRVVHQEDDPNQMQLSIYVEPKCLDEEMNHDDGLTYEVSDLMRHIKSNHEVDGPLTDASRIVSEKQLIEPSSGLTTDEKENDLDFVEEAIGQLDRDLEVLRNVIRNSRSTREKIAQLQQRNKELKERVANKEAKLRANRKIWKERIKNLKNDLLSMTFRDRLKMLHKWREECELNLGSKADNG